MNVELITKADLEQFKKELFEQLKVSKSEAKSTSKDWAEKQRGQETFKDLPGHFTEPKNQRNVAVYEGRRDAILQAGRHREVAGRS